ncbi:MAG TPA: diguanylate cyclase [Povalibacter sp.]|uniref:GGDEF domain-containing protein n=1 Tax=Povalibacter sp. TaxID=1962978 RepID=UPI002BBCFF8C|nr:diguanylate cyclase [Povalibacter sp.]HMN43508.1 diguanylate cyclase [Povalibacter sp.]
MKTAAPETDNWRKKYFDSLSSLEDEHRRFRAMEAVLKKLAGRLCSASLGQTPGLDEQIKRLQSALRREVSHDELEKITPALTEAIQALDLSPAASFIATQPVAVRPAAAPPLAPRIDERVRVVLVALLVELRRDSSLVSQIDAVDARLGAALSPEQLPDVLSSLMDLVGQRIKRIEHARQELEALLTHMASKLDEVGRFVAEQSQAQNQSRASSETLSLQLTGEMKAMGESVEAADDLQQIRGLVRNRLDSIDLHLQAFRQRETAFSNEMRTRNEQMRSRIAELEGRARLLQTQLQDEQRLSAIDQLTKIPNRLAYDKRIEEELERCRRLNAPACLAVMDVDHFKRVNDTYGHRAGDRVLRAVADCLAGRIRRTDFVARYGGEEFVMILEGTRIDDAMRVIDDMRNAIAAIGFHFRGTPVSITISGGVTALLDNDSAGAAFDRADKALYQAKETGRNRCIAG